MADPGGSNPTITKKKRGRPPGTKSKIGYGTNVSHMQALRRKQLDQTESQTHHHQGPASASSELDSSESEYIPSPRKRFVLQDPRSSESDSDTPRNQHNDDSDQYFVGMASTVEDFVHQVNSSMRCKTMRCRGKLVPTSTASKGQGGAIQMKFCCTHCSANKIDFTSTTQVPESRRNVVSLALHVAMFIGGCHYAGIRRCLNLGMGLNVLSPKRFYDIIGLLFPVTQDMLKQHIDRAIKGTRQLPEEEVGSSQRLITTSDGAWLTRGAFSKNFTFTIRDFTNGSLLSVMHLCQRGDDEISEEYELYEGTSKSMEGYAARECFQELKDKDLVVQVNWQDDDSSSGNSFKKVFDSESSKIMLCANHVCRAHRKRLDAMVQTRVFTKAFASRHKAKFPEVESVSCLCQGKNHRQGCGCLSANFIRQAVINQFCAILEAADAKDPQLYAETMRVLGDHHAKNEHVWATGRCSFHPEKSCSCGDCQELDQLKCDGKAYESRSILSCPLHMMAYKIECHARAEQAAQVIHPDLGRGHSNWPESSHHIFTIYRKKDMALHRLHYMTSTNLGVLHSNQVFMETTNADYHWILDLFTELRLPIMNNIRTACKNDIEFRKKEAAVKKGKEKKEQRTRMKVARSMEQEERKQWAKDQVMIHSYGCDDEEIQGSEDVGVSGNIQDAVDAMNQMNTATATATDQPDVELQISAGASASRKSRRKKGGRKQLLVQGDEPLQKS